MVLRKDCVRPIVTDTQAVRYDGHNQVNSEETTVKHSQNEPWSESNSMKGKFVFGLGGAFLLAMAVVTAVLWTPVSPENSAGTGLQERE